MIINGKKTKYLGINDSFNGNSKITGILELGHWIQFSKPDGFKQGFGDYEVDEYHINHPDELQAYLDVSMIDCIEDLKPEQLKYMEIINSCTTEQIELFREFVQMIIECGDYERQL